MVGYVALPWWIATEGGARDLALYGIVISAATIITMPLLSPFGDRYAKRSQIVFGLAALTCGALLVALAATLWHYSLPFLIATGLLTVIAYAFIMPSSINIAAELVPSEHLSDALSLQKTAQAMGRIAGPALAGGVLALGGTKATFWLSFILLISAALLATRIPTHSNEHEDKHSAVATAGKTIGAIGAMAHWWQELRVGLHAKWTIPMDRGWTLVNFISWIFLGPAFTMLVPLKIKSLGLSGGWLGACEAALSIGMLFGALWISNALAHRFGRYRVRVAIAMAEGLALAVVGYASSPWLLVMAFLCAGIANATFVLVGQTHRTLAVPKNFRVRMTAVNIMTTNIAGTLGPAIAGIALLHWHLNTVYITFGVLAALSAGAFMFVPRVREFLELEHHEVKDWYGHQYPEIFAAQASKQ
ncbi:MFS transporter [Glaciimonas sp. GS1]|uniref:MFS transporter n=2 Tax=Glaciimonas soli TaxID=2590999 RepID=A0A843YPI1_9BURK|nr:MFS transporter [Glaciimonas soli]